ncbi:DUF4376 domain-containing protein [Bradyrhizobium sp. S3.7.6]
MNIINHGTWSRYTPDPHPPGLPTFTSFAKSDDNGRDWYDALYSETPLCAADSVKVTALKDDKGNWRTMAANVDATMVFPVNQLLLEITDYNGTDPQADLGGKYYHPDTNTIDAIAPPLQGIGDLIAYANLAQWAKATGGYTTTVNGDTCRIPTSTESLSLINGKFARLQQPNPPTSIAWQVGPTTFVDIPVADFTTLAVAIADFVQVTFDKLRNEVLPAIEAGTITATEQIDTAFATL